MLQPGLFTKAASRFSQRSCKRAEDQDLESMGSLLRCSSIQRNESMGSLRSRRSLDRRHGGIPRPAPAPCALAPCAPVTPSAKERNLLYCVSATPTIPAQRAASAPQSLLATLPSPFDRALSGGDLPRGLSGGGGGGTAFPSFSERSRSGPAAPAAPVKGAAQRRQRWRGDGTRAGLPIVALFLLLTVGLGLGVFVGQHVAGGGGGVRVMEQPAYASPARLAQGLVTAVGIGSAGLHRRVLSGSTESSTERAAQSPGVTAGLERVQGGLIGQVHARNRAPSAAHAGLAGGENPKELVAHISLEGEAGLGTMAAEARTAQRVGRASAGGADPKGSDFEGAAAEGGALPSSWWRSSEEAEAMRAASSEHSEQHAGEDMELLQQVRQFGNQHGRKVR